MRQANQLYGEGDFIAAAAQYATLASDAALPRQRAKMHLRAAQSYAQASAKSDALAQARLALTVARDHGRPQQLAAMLARIEPTFANLGWSADWLALAKEFGVDRPAAAAVAPPAEAAPAEEVTEALPALPASCPACAAPARSDEVTWIDARSAVCAYCGTVLVGAA